MKCFWLLLLLVGCTQSAAPQPLAMTYQPTQQEECGQKALNAEDQCYAEDPSDGICVLIAVEQIQACNPHPF